MRHPGSLTILTLSLACGGSAPAPAPVPEVAQIEAGTTAYRLATWRQVEQTYEGQRIENDAGAASWVTVSLESHSDGFALRVVLDSARTTGPVDIDPAAVRGAWGTTFSGLVAPDGGLTDWPLPADPNALLDQLHASLPDLVVRTPRGGARAGSRWSDTTTLATRAAGLPAVVRCIAEHGAAPAWEDRDGEPALAVTTSVSYTIAAEGERSGRWLALQGNGQTHLERYLTTAGHVIVGSSVDTLILDVEVGGTGLTIPVRQVRADTVQRVHP